MSRSSLAGSTPVQKLTRLPARVGRLGLAGAGIAVGCAAIASTFHLGGAMQLALGSLAVPESCLEVPEIRSLDGPLDVELLETLRPAAGGALLCPELRARGRVGDAEPVFILGIDLVGDPRFRLTAGRLDSTALQAVRGPTAFVTPKLLARLGGAPAVEIDIDGRRNRFALAAEPPPRALAREDTSLVAVVDIGQFHAAFGREDEVDAIAVVSRPGVPSLATPRSLLSGLPQGVIAVDPVRSSAESAAWAATWREIGLVALSIGLLAGVVIVLVSVRALWGAADVAARTGRRLSAALEALGACATGASAGLLLGSLVAGSALRLTSGARSAAPSGIPFWAAVVALLAVGAGIVTRLVERRDPAGRPRVAPRALGSRTAAAGVLLSLASLLWAPLPERHGPLIGYAAALLFLAGLALLGPAVLGAFLRAARRLPGRRLPVPSAVLPSYSRTLADAASAPIAWLFVAFASASLVWAIAGGIRHATDSWLASAYVDDAVVEITEAPGGTGGAVPWVVGVARRLEAETGVATVEARREASVRLGERSIALVGRSMRALEALPSVRALRGAGRDSVLAAVAAGAAVLLPADVAWRLRISPGDSVHLRLPSSEWRGIVAATYRDRIGGETGVLTGLDGIEKIAASDPLRAEVAVSFAPGLSTSDRDSILASVLAGRSVALRYPRQARWAMAAALSRPMPVVAALVAVLLAVSLAAAVSIWLARGAASDAGAILIALGAKPRAIARLERTLRLGIAGGTVFAGAAGGLLAGHALIGSFGLSGFAVGDGATRWLILLVGTAVWLATAALGVILGYARDRVSRRTLPVEAAA